MFYRLEKNEFIVESKKVLLSLTSLKLVKSSNWHLLDNYLAATCHVLRFVYWSEEAFTYLILFFYSIFNNKEFNNNLNSVLTYFDRT